MSKRANKNNLFKKITYNKKISIFFVSLVLLIGAIITTGILLFGDKSEDVSTPKTIAYFYDGEKHDAPPAKEEYVIDVIHCDKAVGEWDNIKWNLTLKEIEGKTTCVLNYKKRFSIHTLEIDPNGGKYNGSTGLSQIEIKETKTVELSQPTRKGYTFSGWTVDNESSKVSGNVFAMGDQNTKITANWTVNTYQIEIRESNTCDGTKSGNYNQRIALCAPEKEGYTFTGWETTSGTIEGNALVLDDSNAIVTAKWTANDYDYIVVHKQEALSGAYTIVDTETHNAAIGTTVRPDTKTYTGFTSPEKHSLTISANSSNNILQYLYTRNSYTLTINPGEGETSTQLEQELKYEQSIEIQNPTRRGYSFTGWTKTSGTLQDNIFTMGSSNATLTANYQAKSMALQFDANQGAVSPTSKTVTYDLPYGTLPTPVREGYVFDGWYVAGNKIESTTTVNIVEATSAVAHWTKGSYILTINPEGGLYNNSTSTVTQGMEFEDEITIEDPVREGYTFDGWTVSGTGSTFNTNTKVFKIGASNATLTANWTINSYEYMVNHKIEGLNGSYEIANTDTDSATYNATINPDTREYTGFTAPEIQTITIGVENNVINYLYTRNSYTLTINPGAGTTTTPLTQTLKYQQTTEVANPTRRGYNFTGWSKVGNSTLSGTTLTMGSENTTLTANYEAKTFTITFNANEGSVSSTSKTVTFAQNYGELPTPVREGYDFNGWYLNGTKIESTTTVNIEDNATLVANWTRGTNTLSIIPNGGKYNNSSDVTTMTLQYEDEANIQDASREGYTFDGWTVAGTGATFNANTKVFKMGSTNASLTAKWAINKYNLTIQDTNVCDGTYNINYLGTYTLCTPQREGYTFDGWEDTDSLITNNVATMKAKDSVIKAKWRVNSYSYTITHSKMNLDGETYTEVEDDRVTGTAEYGTVIIPETKTYLGFNSPDAQTITIGVSNNIINYNYERIKRAVTIEPNGGTYSGSTSLELYFDQQVTLASPSKTGHNFTGWTKDEIQCPVGGSTVVCRRATIENNVLTMGTENTTLTASYSARTYTVIFNPNQGSVTTTSKTVTYDQQYGELPTPVRTYTTFEGWYTDPDNGTKVISTDIVKITSSQTLYAHWDDDYAVFDRGENVNKLMKQLAGGSNVYFTTNTNISSIERSTTLSNTSNNISVEGKPIYIWFDNGKIKWYSEASKVFLNTDASYMFAWFSGLTGINLSQYNSSKVTNMSHLFVGDKNITSLNLSPLDTSKVTNMDGMFSYCSSLTSIDLSPLNTSNVISMRGIFFEMSGVTSINLSHLDTSNVVDMAQMFHGMTNLRSINLLPLDTSKVTNMDEMFYNCSSLTSIDLSPLNTSNVISMEGIFEGMSGITSINLSPLDTSNVVDMTRMFYGMTGLTSLDLSPLNTNNVQYMSNMFSGLTGLTSINLSPLNTSNVIQMANMFGGMSGLTSIDLRPLDTSMVTNMTGMFSGMSNLTSINLSGFNTSNATTTNNMFASDGKLTSIDLSSFNTSNVTNMGSCGYEYRSLYGGGGGWSGCGMFEGMTSLTSLDLSNFDTSSVTNMGDLFSGDENLANLYIRSFNTQNVMDMHGMFHTMKSITNLDLTNFNTENVTNMGWDSLTISDNSMGMGGGAGMFSHMNNLTTLDISSFDTSNVTNMKGMFMYCPNLTTIYASDKWSVASVTEDTGMFYGDTSLRGGAGTTFSASYIGKERARIDAGSSGRGYFTYKAAPSN